MIGWAATKINTQNNGKNTDNTKVKLTTNYKHLSGSTTNTKQAE